MVQFKQHVRVTLAKEKDWRRTFEFAKWGPAAVQVALEFQKMADKELVVFDLRLKTTGVPVKDSWKVPKLRQVLGQHMTQGSFKAIEQALCKTALESCQVDPSKTTLTLEENGMFRASYTKENGRVEQTFPTAKASLVWLENVHGADKVPCAWACTYVCMYVCS